MNFDIYYYGIKEVKSSGSNVFVMLSKQFILYSVRIENFFGIIPNRYYNKRTILKSIRTGKNILCRYVYCT